MKYWSIYYFFNRFESCQTKMKHIKVRNNFHETSLTVLPQEGSTSL